MKFKITLSILLTTIFLFSSITTKSLAATNPCHDACIVEYNDAYYDVVSNYRTEIYECFPSEPWVTDVYNLWSVANYQMPLLEVPGIAQIILSSDTSVLGCLGEVESLHNGAFEGIADGLQRCIEDCH